MSTGKPINYTDVSIAGGGRHPAAREKVSPDTGIRFERILFRQPDKGGGANGTVYRTDNQGNITSYAVYDSEGMIIKRVDITGAAHTDVSTLHVIEYGRNKLPDGTVRVQSPSTKLASRPAKSDEIP